MFFTPERVPQIGHWGFGGLCLAYWGLLFWRNILRGYSCWWLQSNIVHVLRLGVRNLHVLVSKSVYFPVGSLWYEFIHENQLERAAKVGRIKRVIIVLHGAELIHQFALGPWFPSVRATGNPMMHLSADWISILIDTSGRVELKRDVIMDSAEVVQGTERFLWHPLGQRFWLAAYGDSFLQLGDLQKVELAILGEFVQARLFHYFLICLLFLLQSQSACLSETWRDSFFNKFSVLLHICNGCWRVVSLLFLDVRVIYQTGRARQVEVAAAWEL